MNVPAVEVLIILLLLLANGLFAMTEIAVVSARKARLRYLADGGNARARAALELAESPNRFLSTVQVGITLVGILAGAFGGATFASQIAEALREVPLLARYSDTLGLAVVVVTITYLSLVVGELVPKRIGLGKPEAIAMAVAKPMHALSRLASPAVKFLGFSTDLLLKLLPFKPGKEALVSEEEVQGLMQEGLRAGAFNKVESQIVRRALELDRLLTRDLMTPRPRIIWLNKNDAHDVIWHKIVVSGHSYFPVYENNRDNVVGIVSLKAIYAHLAAGIPVRLADLMTPPLVVPDTQIAIQLLETFKSTGKHIALVADEFGSIVGLVTLHDVMEAVIGEFPSREERAKPRIKKRDDGSWLVDAIIEIEEVEAALPGLRLQPGPGQSYQTLAGFVVSHLGRLPAEGDTLQWQGYVFEILDMDRHRVDKVLVTPLDKLPPRQVDPSI
ncbi:MAG TPA: hemolysin family protein [Verrucomicrobiota bacterium]|jgi:putative hemolysin|nr:hemolysin family protein [Verrucomicrobiota bacterium]HRT10487.1 hemolysin family protein [Candidatus Paceibacterota bacterium]HRT58984.1 hemolysin family protein [Candidatus Paceibacterota bacterium]